MFIRTRCQAYHYQLSAANRFIYALNRSSPYSGKSVVYEGGDGMYQNLYEVSEQANVNFIGWAAEQGRYDFALIYSNHFIGKTLVVCMQTGRSTLLCEDDLKPELLMKSFQLNDLVAAEEAGNILRTRVPSLEVRDQY
ncbi:DUF3055 domain-containing protein [Paenibacillus marinisediminis]